MAEGTRYTTDLSWIGDQRGGGTEDFSAVSSRERFLSDARIQTQEIIGSEILPMRK
ncbi:MAG: hypothetical protein WCJ84_01640 [Candidatus Peregrinibacteria bacterium]